jgi:hypothetical protein
LREQDPERQISLAEHTLDWFRYSPGVPRLPLPKDLLRQLVTLDNHERELLPMLHQWRAWFLRLANEVRDRHTKSLWADPHQAKAHWASSNLKECHQDPAEAINAAFCAFEPKIAAIATAAKQHGLLDLIKDLEAIKANRKAVMVGQTIYEQVPESHEAAARYHDVLVRCLPTRQTFAHKSQATDFTSYGRRVVKTVAAMTQLCTLEPQNTVLAADLVALKRVNALRTRFSPLTSAVQYCSGAIRLAHLQRLPRYGGHGSTASALLTRNRSTSRLLSSKPASITILPSWTPVPPAAPY